MKRMIRANALTDAKQLVDTIFLGIDKLFKSFMDLGYEFKKEKELNDGSTVYIIDTGTHKCKLKVTPIGDRTDVVDLVFKPTEKELASKTIEYKAKRSSEMKKTIKDAITRIYGKDAEDGESFEDITDEKSGESKLKEFTRRPKSTSGRVTE